MNDPDARNGSGYRAEPREAQTARQVARLNRTLWIAIAITLTLLLLAWAGSTMIVIFAGVLLGTVLHGLSEWLGRRTGISRGWSLAIICVAVVVVIGLTAWWIGPNVADQLAQLGQQLRSSWDSVMQRLQGSGMLSNIGANLTLDKIAAQLQPVLGGLMNVASTALALIGGVIVIVFIGLYSAATPETYTAGPIWIAPANRRDKVRELFRAVASTLQWWFLARVMSMTAVGVLTAAGLWLIGMPLFIALGFLSAIFSFVPYLGPIAAAIPAILIGLAQGPTMALYVALVYIGVQTLESYLITPQIVQRAINLPAAGVLVMQLLFGVFFGVLGVAFASPISATILTIVEKTVRRPDLDSEHSRS
jgi:predicted PurR-regulated permease PerM